MIAIALMAHLFLMGETTVNRSPMEQTRKTTRWLATSSSQLLYGK